MRANGRILARCMRVCGEAIVPGKTTTADLDAIAERLIEEAGAKPSFKGYRGFPAATCISVNEVVVHGIPGDRVIQEGDIVDIDLGVYKDGFHVDSAWTFPAGAISDAAKRQMNITRESMMQGIQKAKVGAKVGEISATIQRYVESAGYGVIRDLVGHGIGRNLHEEPSVPNFGSAKVGPVLREGMTICIEPMVSAGTWRVKELADGWTIVTADGGLCAHYEHTVAITKDGPEILTIE